VAELRRTGVTTWRVSLDAYLHPGKRRMNSEAILSTLFVFVLALCRSTRALQALRPHTAWHRHTIEQDPLVTESDTKWGEPLTDEEQDAVL
jgi:hypothetical protein